MLRKRNRLENYDYGNAGIYFVTICTKDRKNLFWIDENHIPASPQEVNLSNYGRIAEAAIKNIERHYPDAEMDNYTVMPNHIHLLITLNCGDCYISKHKISEIIKQFKRFVTRQIGQPLWQKSFYDHIIRNEEDYLNTFDYITYNPQCIKKTNCIYNAISVFYLYKLYFVAAVINRQAD